MSAASLIERWRAWRGRCRAAQNERLRRADERNRQKEIDECLRRADRIMASVSEEEHTAGLPGGVFGTYWTGGSGPERDKARSALIRRWSKMEAEARRLRSEATARETQP